MKYKVRAHIALEGRTGDPKEPVYEFDDLQLAIEKYQDVVAQFSRDVAYYEGTLLVELKDEKGSMFYRFEAKGV